MKQRLIVILLMMAAAALATVPQVSGQQGDGDFQERDEIRQTYQLSSGARVEVSSISGSVEIETADVSAAEVHIVRSARKRADLEYRKIIIEHTPASLVIRGEQDRERRRGVDVRQRVRLRVPRQIDLTVNSVSGSAKVGDVAGPVRINSVSGSVTIGNVGGQVRVSSVSGTVKIGDVAGQVSASSISGSFDVGQTTGHLDVSSISGGVTAGIARLDERGVQVSSISGSVELRAGDDLNADLKTSNISGKVHLDVPNVTVQGKLDSSNVRARIGNGGASISISNVSGNVRLTRGV